MQRSWLRMSSVIGLAVVVLSCCSSLFAEDATIARIMDDWRARRKLASRVEYRVKGMLTFLPGYANEDIDDLGVGEPRAAGENIPATAYKAPVEGRVLLDFQQSRLRKESEQDYFLVATRDFKRSFEAWLYDGKQFQIYRPRDRSSYAGKFGVDLVWNTDTAGQTFFEPADYPFLFGHGIVNVGDVTKVGPNQPELDMRQHRVVGTVVIDGCEAQVIRSPASRNGWFEEYAIDLERQSAIVRWKRARADDLGNTLDVKYGQTARGWFPTSWSYLHHDGLEPQLIEEIGVESIVFDPVFEASEFHVAERPNMTVEDRRNGSSYMVCEDGYKRDLLMLEMRHEEETSSPKLALVSIGAAIIAGIAFIVFRKMRA
jgi:hypothetical protein